MLKKLESASAAAAGVALGLSNDYLPSSRSVKETNSDLVLSVGFKVSLGKAAF